MGVRKLMQYFHCLAHRFHETRSASGGKCTYRFSRQWDRAAGTDETRVPTSASCVIGIDLQNNKEEICEVNEARLFIFPILLLQLMYVNTLYIRKNKSYVGVT
jgi:hypothetical protein